VTEKPALQDFLRELLDFLKSRPYSDQYIDFNNTAKMTVLCEEGNVVLALNIE
jgi:hypothetical protein